MDPVNGHVHHQEKAEKGPMRQGPPKETRGGTHLFMDVSEHWCYFRLGGHKDVLRVEVVHFDILCWIFP